jgi:hypothetical protein
VAFNGAMTLVPGQHIAEKTWMLKLSGIVVTSEPEGVRLTIMLTKIAVCCASAYILVCVVVNLKRGRRGWAVVPHATFFRELGGQSSKLRASLPRFQNVAVVKT